MNELLFTIFIGATAVQLIYWMLFLLAISFYKNKIGSESENKAGVSIIICAYNELNNLQNLIPKLYEQNFSEYEIIVVNDRSTDGTYEFLLEESQSNKLLKMIGIERSPDHIDSKKYAITLGVKAAKFEKLVFTDADCLPKSNNWIRLMSNSFGTETEFVLGYSQFKEESGIVNMFSRFETQITGMLYNSFAIIGNPYMAVGRNLAYRKSTFLKNKGFNQFQKVTGGDDDLLVNHFGTKKNLRVYMGKESLVWSYSKNTLLGYYKQKLRHISVSKYYKLKDKFLLTMYSLSHLLFWLAFVNLAAVNYFPEMVFGILAFRLIFNCLVITSTSKKFGERILIWTIPIMDFIYCFYLIIMGIAALGTKKVKWN
jgi:glycosyltransferase involved in cell wall biosynthesis